MQPAVRDYREDEVARLKDQLAVSQAEKANLTNSLVLLATQGGPVIPPAHPPQQRSPAQPLPFAPPQQLSYYSSEFVLPPKEKKAVPIVAPPRSTTSASPANNNNGHGKTSEPTDVLLLGAKGDRGPFLFRLEFADGDRRLNFPVHEFDQPEDVAQRIRSVLSEAITDEQFANWIKEIRKQQRQVLQRRSLRTGIVATSSSSAAARVRSPAVKTKTPPAIAAQSSHEDPSRFSVLPDTQAAPAPVSVAPVKQVAPVPVTAPTQQKQRQPFVAPKAPVVPSITPKLAEPNVGQEFNVSDWSSPAAAAAKPATVDDWSATPANNGTEDWQTSTSMSAAAAAAPPAMEDWQTSAAPAPAAALAVDDWAQQGDASGQQPPNEDSLGLSGGDYQPEAEFGLHRKWPWMSNGGNNKNNGKQGPPPVTAAASVSSSATPKPAPQQQSWQQKPAAATPPQQEWQQSTPAAAHAPPKAAARSQQQSFNAPVPKPAYAAPAPSQFANVQGNPNAKINELPPPPELVPPSYSPDELSAMNSWASGGVGADAAPVDAVADEWD